MKISQALKEKNRLVSEINKVKERINKNNSIIVNNTRT